MPTKIIIPRSKPNYFSMLLSLVMCYWAYDHLTRTSYVMGGIAAVLAVVGMIHTILLLTTPLLIQENDSLIVKPKIPFERKVILVDELKEAKALSDAVLQLTIEGNKKIKLDLGGFKPKEIAEIRTHLQSLV